MYNIMIVDDDKGLIEVIREYILQSSDIDVLKTIQLDCYTDSLEALSMLKNKKYHIIATDLKMPDINGHQLLLEGKKLDAYQKAILFTAYGDKTIVQDLLNSGLIDLMLDKPLMLYEFRDSLFKILKQCKTDEALYQDALELLARLVLKGENIEKVLLDLHKSIIIQGDYKIREIAEKTGINKDKLYSIYRKMRDEED